jgi:hypothetical protein
LMTLLVVVVSVAVTWWAFREVVGALRNARDAQAIDPAQRARPSVLGIVVMCVAVCGGAVVGLYAFDSLSEVEGRLMMVGLLVFIVIRLRAQG